MDLVINDRKSQSLPEKKIEKNEGECVLKSVTNVQNILTQTQVFFTCRKKSY